jgi:hypothetical protein
VIRTRSDRSGLQGSPPTDSKEIIRSLGEIRNILSKLDTVHQGKIARALDDAEEEAKKEPPDKNEVAGALQRAVKYAKSAEAVGKVIGELKGPVSTIASWIGEAAPAASRLFGLLP